MFFGRGSAGLHEFHFRFHIMSFTTVAEWDPNAKRIATARESNGMIWIPIKTQTFEWIRIQLPHMLAPFGKQDFKNDNRFSVKLTCFSWIDFTLRV